MISCEKKTSGQRAQGWAAKPIQTLHLPADNRAGRERGIRYSVCVCVVSMTEWQVMEGQAELLVQRGQRIVFVCLIWHNAVSLHCIPLSEMETEYTVMNWGGEGKHKGKHWPQAHNAIRFLHYTVYWLLNVCCYKCFCLVLLVNE